MSDSSPLYFKKLIFFSIAVLGLCLLPKISFAQENMGKIDLESPKSSEKLNQENTINLLEGNSNSNNNQKQTVLVQKPATGKKDNIISSEIKKSESTPSTLNFNIFLYIVDKFKAD
jgi:hypothetical protein